MSNAIHIGIVGLNFGRHILNGLAAEDNKRYFKPVAVCDMNLDKANAIAAASNLQSYDNLDSLLTRDDIPVIGLFTGPTGRAELIRKIIRSGRDVITTKPFETDALAARDVLAEAARLGRRILMNSPAPEAHPCLRQIEAWQSTHALGRPVAFRGEVTASYRETSDGSWMDDPQRCPAAPLTRLGIYLINDIITLFGRVVEVQVTTSRIFTGRPTPDNAQLSLLFENHAIGSIFASFCVENGQQYGNSMTLHYERGTILRNTGLYDYGKTDGFSELRMTCVRGEQQCTREEWTFPGTSGHYAWSLMHRILLDPACNPIPQFEIVHGIEVLESMIRAERSGRSETVTSTP